MHQNFTISTHKKETQYAPFYSFESLQIFAFSIFRRAELQNKAFLKLLNKKFTSFSQKFQKSKLLGKIQGYKNVSDRFSVNVKFDRYGQKWSAIIFLVYSCKQEARVLV